MTALAKRELTQLIDDWKRATMASYASPATGVPLSYPDPAKPVGPWSRVQLSTRIHALRLALDLLGDQSARDGHGLYACTGAMKVNLIGLENALLDLDRAEQGLAEQVRA